MIEESQVVKFVHAGVEVVYWERENVWKFTLRGRERRADNPLKAKEAIDKPVPSDKAKAFQRVKAIHLNYSDAVTYGEVTSLADTEDYKGNPEVWFVSSTGNRSKESVNRIYADTVENRAICDQAKALDDESALLRKKADRKRKEMIKLKIEVPE